MHIVLSIYCLSVLPSLGQPRPSICPASPPHFALLLPRAGRSSAARPSAHQCSLGRALTAPTADALAQCAATLHARMASYSAQLFSMWFSSSSFSSAISISLLLPFLFSRYVIHVWYLHILHLYMFSMLSMFLLFFSMHLYVFRIPFL